MGTVYTIFCKYLRVFFMFEDTNRYTVFVQLALVGYESTTEYSHCMCQCMSVQFDVNKK